MNHYTEVLYHIKAIAEKDPYISTITQDDEQELDLDKKNIYPLLHIDITGGRFTNGRTVQLDVLLVCLTVRDERKHEEPTDKFWRQDNKVDNFNETMACLNRIWTYLSRDYEFNNITASENPELVKYDGEKANVLDGWGLDFSIEVPNTTLNLCSDVYSEG